MSSKYFNFFFFLILFPISLGGGEWGEVGAELLATLNQNNSQRPMIDWIACYQDRNSCISSLQLLHRSSSFVWDSFWTAPYSPAPPSHTALLSLLPCLSLLKSPELFVTHQPQKSSQQVSLMLVMLQLWNRAKASSSSSSFLVCLDVEIFQMCFSRPKNSWSKLKDLTSTQSSLVLASHRLSLMSLILPLSTSELKLPLLKALLISPRYSCAKSLFPL